MQERWKPIPNFEDYEVSDLGRVRSWKRHGGTGRALKPRILKQGRRKKHPYVALRANGRTINKVVGHLVAEAFLEPRTNPSLKVGHLDKDPANNKPGNLFFASHQELCMHMATGGESRYQATLTNDQASKMRAMAGEGKMPKELAAIFGVRTATVYGVLSGRSYREQASE